MINKNINDIEQQIEKIIIQLENNIDKIKKYIKLQTIKKI